MLFIWFAVDCIVYFFFHLHFLQKERLAQYSQLSIWVVWCEEHMARIHHLRDTTRTLLFFSFFFSVGFSSEAMRTEAIRQDPTRKGSVVNVNPTNTRPQSDTPEIRKYKKRFNSEILCAALWGKENLFLACLLQCWSADMPLWPYGLWEPLSQTLAVSVHFFNACVHLFAARSDRFYYSFAVCFFCFDTVSYFCINASNSRKEVQTSLSAL